MLFNFGLADDAADLDLSDVDPRYARIRDRVGTSARTEAGLDRLDIIFRTLWSKEANRPNPFNLKVSELAGCSLAAEPAALVFAADTPAATPNTSLAAEFAVTGLRAPGAPSHTLLDHERAPATA